MRKALVIGINDYDANSLNGSVNDAVRMHTLLWRHHDDKVNFQSRLWTAPAVHVGMAKGPSFPAKIDQAALRMTVENFFDDKHCTLAVLYFAGHGLLNKLGGYLVTQGAQKYSEGLSMNDLLTIAQNSPILEIVIILDCCHSGAFGQSPTTNGVTTLRDGITILSACSPSGAAREEDNKGVFTTLVGDALDGGAADVQGKVTVASVYAYAEGALGAFEQRPYFKASVAQLSPLRQCLPTVSDEILRRLPEFFKKPSDEYPLDPSHEPDAGLDNPVNQAIFAQLQILRDGQLLVPVGERHLYYAAMRSKQCKLTPLGRLYWRLANEGKL